MASVLNNLGWVVWERGVEGRDAMFTHGNTRKCCVPGWTNKVYEEDNINKIHFIPQRPSFQYSFVSFAN